MSTHWKDWEKAKKDLKGSAAAKRSAVDDALSVIRGAQKASKDNPNAMRCPKCGGVKFKTLTKGEKWACRACGETVTRQAETK